MKLPLNEKARTTAPRFIVYLHVYLGHEATGRSHSHAPPSDELPQLDAIFYEPWASQTLDGFLKCSQLLRAITGLHLPGLGRSVSKHADVFSSPA